MKRFIVASLIAISAIVALPLANSSVGALECTILPADVCSSAESDGTEGEGSSIFKILIIVVKVLTAAVGVVAVGALVYAGIMYASAGGDGNQVAEAKKLIRNTIIGIVVFGLMATAINWLVPGGLL